MLGDSLYTALRDGLAHGFDTKHLDVGSSAAIQIYISWGNQNVVEIRRVGGDLGVFVGVQPLAEALIAKIDAFEAQLRANEETRTMFKEACEYQRVKPLDHNELAAWNRLVEASVR